MTVTRFVADTSVIAQAIVEETNSPRVATLLADVLSPELAIQLWIPDYCLVECGNVLWTYVQFKGLSQHEADSRLQRLLELPLRIASAQVLLPHTLRLAATHRITVYDAGFLALADRLKCPLITGDSKQAQIAGAMGVLLKPITDFPVTSL